MCERALSFASAKIRLVLCLIIAAFGGYRFEGVCLIRGRADEDGVFQNCHVSEICGENNRAVDHRLASKLGA